MSPTCWLNGGTRRSPHDHAGSGTGRDDASDGGSGLPGGEPWRVLFLCHTLPHPPDGGVWIRSYHALKALAQEFDVTALCFERSGEEDHDVEQAVRQLGSLASTETFRVPQEEAALRKVRDHVLSLLTGRVFTVFKHRNRRFRRRLRHHLEEGDFDLVHVDSLDLSTHLPLLRGLPVVCVHHNVESQLFRRRATFESNPLLRWYFRHQARLQEREERRWCGKVDLNVTVSEEDRETLREIVPEARVTVVPNGVDVERYRPWTGPVDGVVFVGGAGWFPNRDGMEFFCEEVLPLIRSRIPDVTVRWVGSVDESDRRRFQEEHGVRMTGYVEDVRPPIGQAACEVVPLRIGGGSRLKILEAWAMGKAVVSTSRGCEGLEARDEDNLLVRDDPRGFADAVVRVLHDRALRERLGRNARRTAVESYSWRAIGEEMVAAYRSLVDGSAGTGLAP